MLEIRVLTRADGRNVPWKNGRGTTLELAVWPEGSSLERADFAWRLSAARVAENGPFSLFPGCERILTVTEGAGLVLAHGPAAPRARLRRLEPYRFAGDWPTTAELVAGPIADFNVIQHRERAQAEVQAFALGQRRARETLAAGHAFLHVLAGQLTARITGEEEPFGLEAGSSLWVRGLRGGEELELTGRRRELELLLVSLSGERA